MGGEGGEGGSKKKKKQKKLVIESLSRGHIPEFCIKQTMKWQPRSENRFVPPDPATDESHTTICVPGQHCHSLFQTNHAPYPA